MTDANNTAPAPDADPAYSADFILNQSTKEFFTTFFNAFNTADLPELRQHYFFGFNELQDKYFKDTPWPDETAIAPLCSDNSFFQMLYKELTIRHLHGLNKATVNDRIDGYYHFLEMFDFILQWGNEMPYQLPLEWLFDIINEFVYQFQAYWQFVGRASDRTREDIKIIEENPDAWKPGLVLWYLQELQAASVIKEAIVADRDGKPLPERPNQILHMLGYFAIIGESRIHLMIGDYTSALKAVDVIDFSQPGLFSRVRTCHVMLFYCTGFAYMMLRRFHDATRIFATMIVYLQSASRQTGNVFQKFVQKKHDQMLNLLALMQSVSSDLKVDSLVQKKINDVNEKIPGLQSADEVTFKQAFQSLFNYGGPKFIVPSKPDYTSLSKSSSYDEARMAQSEPFISELCERKKVNEVAFYLKLYSTVTIKKLASLLSKDTDKEPMTEQQAISRLLCLKYKSMDKIWKSGSPLSGKTKSTGEVHFYIKGESVHITNSDKLTDKSNSFIGRYFIEHTQKFNKVTTDIQKAWEGCAPLPFNARNISNRRGGNNNNNRFKGKRGGRRGGRGGRRGGRGRMNNNRGSGSSW